MIFLKQSTASQEVPLGYFVDSGDGNTEETSLTINASDIKLWKNGATTLANKNSGGATHISNGIYYAVLDATDTNTLGPMVIFCKVSGALAVRVECCVLDAVVFDSLIAATDKLQVDAVQCNGTNLTARDIGASVLLSSGTGTGQVSLSSGTVTVGTNNDKTGYTVSTVSDKTGYSLSSGGIQAIWDALTSALSTANSIGKLLVDNINATISSRLASASYTAPLDAAGVRSAVGLASANLDTQLTAIDDYLDTEVAAIKAKTDNLPASPAATGDIPTAGAIADAVWDEAISDHLTAGSTGAALNAAGSSGDPWSTPLPGAYGSGTAGKILGDNLNATVSSRSSHSAGDVWSVGTRTLTGFGSLVSDIWAAVVDSAGVTTLLSRLSSDRAGKLDNLDAAVTTRSSHSAADVATAVWAAATRTLTSIADSSGVTTLLSRLSNDRAGNLDNLDTTVSSRLATSGYAAPLDAAGTRTAVGLASANLDTQLSGISSKTTNLPAAPAAVGDIPTATENADALLKRDMSVVTGEASRSPLNALRFLRNKWNVAAGTLTVTKENDSTTAWTATVSTDAGADPITGSDPD